MNQKEFIDFYNNSFLPVYADTVAFIADKPAQIIIEIENTFSHITQYLNTANTLEIQTSNLEKAYNHLLRATIDCYKILWVAMSEEIEVFMGNNNSRKFSVNLSENEAMYLWMQFKTNAQEARRIELAGIGIQPEGAIEAYKKTIEIGWQLLKNCDREKLKALKTFSFKSLMKQQWIGFLVGVASSALVTYLFTVYGSQP